MPHDMRDKVLSVGDRVLIPAIVTNVHAGEDYCNVTVVTARHMPPYDTGTTVTLNTRQTAKVDHLLMLDRNEEVEATELFPDAPVTPEFDPTSAPG